MTRRWSFQTAYSEVNRIFTFLCFLAPNVAGSAVSFLYNGGGIWAIIAIFRDKNKLNIDRSAAVLTASIYIYCFSYFLSTDLNGTLPTSTPRLVSLASFLVFPFTYSSWTISDKWAIARASVIGSALACYGGFAMALYQYFELHIRSEGGAGNPIVFATMAGMASVVCIAGMLSGIFRPSAPLIGACVAALVSIVLSGTRIALVAFPIAVIVILLCYWPRVSAAFTARNLLVFFVTLAAIVALGYPEVSYRLHLLPQDWEALSVNGNYDTSLGLHLGLWKIGILSFEQMPLFGHSPGATGSLIRAGYRSLYGLDISFSHFHNGFLTALVEVGLVGTAALVAIFLVIVTIAVQALRRETAAPARFGAGMLLGMVAIYVSVGMTGIMFGHDIMDSVFLITAAVGTYLSSGRSLVDGNRGSEERHDLAVSTAPGDSNVLETSRT